MQFRSHQPKAIRFLATRKRGILVAPAASGKTIIGAGALAEAVAARQRTEPVRIGWMAPTVDILAQGVEAMAKFPILAKQDIRAACAHPALDMSDRQVLVVDECKSGHSPTWKRIIEGCQGARWGLDATPYGTDDEKNKVLRELFGNEEFVIERDEVKEYLVTANVVLLNAHDPDTSVRVFGEIDRLMPIRKRQFRGQGKSEGDIYRMVVWQAIQSIGIADNSARNKAGLAAALAHADDPRIVLVNTVDHGTWLAEQIPGAIMCHSGMPRKKRRDTMTDFRAGKVPCIVATSLADQGLDLANASVLVLMSGGRSQNKAEQRTGRVLRKHEGKETGIIYDFLDLGHPLMEKHAKSRIARYNELGYQITIA